MLRLICWLLLGWDISPKTLELNLDHKADWYRENVRLIQKTLRQEVREWRRIAKEDAEKGKMEEFATQALKDLDEVAAPYEPLGEYTGFSSPGPGAKVKVVLAHLPIQRDILSKVAADIAKQNAETAVFAADMTGQIYGRTVSGKLNLMDLVKKHGSHRGIKAGGGPKSVQGRFIRSEGKEAVEKKLRAFARDIEADLYKASCEPEPEPKTMSLDTGFTERAYPRVTCISVPVAVPDEVLERYVRDRMSETKYYEPTLYIILCMKTRTFMAGASPTFNHSVLEILYDHGPSCGVYDPKGNLLFARTQTESTPYMLDKLAEKISKALAEASLALLQGPPRYQPVVDEEILDEGNNTVGRVDRVEEKGAWIDRGGYHMWVPNYRIAKPPSVGHGPDYKLTASRHVLLYSFPGAVLLGSLQNWVRDRAKDYPDRAVFAFSGGDLFVGCSRHRRHDERYNTVALFEKFVYPELKPSPVYFEEVDGLVSWVEVEAGLQNFETFGKNVEKFLNNGAS